MKITNNLNLPEPLYRAIQWQEQQHSVGDADISCTRLIDSPLIAYLERKFGDQIVEDASERLWPLYGTISHTILERFAGEGQYVETEAIAEVDGMRISGHIDLVVLPDGSLQDYKLTSAYTVQNALRYGKPDWERQLNVYHYLLTHSVDDSGLQNLTEINRLQIVAMLRDYGPRHQQDGLKPVEILDIPLWNPDRALAYIQERVALHKAAMGDAMPPQCSPEETWRGKRCLNYCAFGKQALCPYI